MPRVAQGTQGVGLALAGSRSQGLAQKIWLEGWDQTWAGMQGGGWVWGLEGSRPAVGGHSLLTALLAVSLPLAQVDSGSGFPGRAVGTRFLWAAASRFFLA